MALAIALKPDQRKDLVKIISLKPDSLRQLRTYLESSSGFPLTPGELNREISKNVSTLAPNAEVVTRVLVSLSLLARESNFDIDTLLSALRTSLSETEKQDALAAWDVVATEIKGLLSLAALTTIAKALDLTFDYPNLLESARLLCDIRPIFVEDDTDISGAIISHTLTIEYRASGQRKKIELALDTNDVMNVLRQCERVKNKVATIKRKLDSIEIKSFAAGEEKTHEN